MCCSIRLYFGKITCWFPLLWIKAVSDHYRWYCVSYIVAIYNKFALVHPDCTLHYRISLSLLIFLTGVSDDCVKRVWRYQRDNQNPYIKDEQTTQWPKVKGQKDKQRSTKHTYKTKDRVTRTPLNICRVFLVMTQYGHVKDNLLEVYLRDIVGIPLGGWSVARQPF